MRRAILMASACLLVVAGRVPAQERVPLPPPDGGTAQAAPGQPLPGSPVPVAPDSPAQPSPPPPGPYPPAPPPYPPPGGYPVYPPPPVIYEAPPPLRRALLFDDPAGNPIFWTGIDGLIWWSKSQPLSVPLLTTGPASQGASAGNLGAPGTVSLDGPLDYGAQGGIRVYAGGWFDLSHCIGMDGSLFVLGTQSRSFGAADNSGVGNFVINEPVAGAPFSTQVSAPGIDTGSAFVRSTSQFGGGDINLLYNLYRGHGWTVNLLGGYRYLELDETLAIGADSTLLTTSTYTDNFGNVLATAPPGSEVTVFDSFRTENQFNGGQIGAEFKYLYGRWVFDGAAKIAFGGTHEVVTINGATNVFPVNAPPVFLSGGNYATLQIGRYRQDRFAVAPEALLNVGYQFTPWLRGEIGYDFLFLSSVLRPGNQIDNTYDGVSHPGVPMSTSSFWAQGLNLGLVFSF
jgi:Putative beta barrel porin-7 (BBP7)